MNLKDASAGFMAGYFSTCKRSAKTRSAYEVDLAQMQIFVGTEALLKDIGPEKLEDWAAQMRAKDYAAVSIRRKFATARVFFTYWVRKGAIDKSPLWRIRLDLGRERVLPRSLSAADAKRLIEIFWSDMESLDCGSALRPRDPEFLRFRNLAVAETLFATGIRVGELVSLNLGAWRDDEACFVVKGKGSRERLAFLPDDRSLKALRAYVVVRRSMSHNEEALFLNASGGRISTQGIARVLASAATNAKLSVRVTPHMIRHTVATLLLRFGADIRVVQEVLGHASIATTQRYTHVSKEHMLSTLRARHPSYHLGIDTQSAKAS